MAIRIGVIGPKDSLDRIAHAKESMEEEFDLVLGVYDVKEETVELTKKIQNEVEVLLYSGIIPYRIASRAGVITKPALFIPRIGLSLARILWDLKNRGLPYRRLSVDSVDLQDVLEIAEELGFQFERIEIIDYDAQDSYEDLANKHIAYINSRQTQVAITGLSRTHQMLRDNDICSYKVLPTLYVIRENLLKALYIGDVQRQRAAQLSVIILKLKNEGAADYQFLKLRNRFENGLITLANQVFGTFHPLGHDEFLLFATRGVIEAEHFESTLLRTLSKITQSFSAGLGYGNTVHRAEMNARLALNRAIGHQGVCLYRMESDGRLHGPIRDSQLTLSYQLQETNPMIKRVAADLGLSTAYVGKIQALIDATNNRRFSAEEFATVLEISPRSARRILKNFEDKGYAEIVAHESPNKTGRPRKIYEIDLSREHVE